MVCGDIPAGMTPSPGRPRFVVGSAFLTVFEDFPECTTGLHNRIQDKSTQEPVETGRAPRPIPGGVEHDSQGDVPSNSETQGEYGPLAHHHSPGRMPRRFRTDMVWRSEKRVEARLLEFWLILFRSR